MNNALSPSSSESESQALPTASNNNNDGAIPSSTEDDDRDRVPANNSPGGGDVGGDTPEQRARRLHILKTTAFLDQLIRGFDLVVYCQISVLYYMDISFISLLLRSIFHLILLTPKRPFPPPFPPFPPSSPQPSLFIILLTNLLPLLIHVFASPPEGTEATRGYLHGGIVIDFVGYKAPASKARLVGMDLLLVGLQVVMMGLVVRRREMEIASRRDGGSGAGAGAGGGGVGSFVQQRQQEQRRQQRRARDTNEEERGRFSLSSSETEEEEQERGHPQSTISSSAYASARGDNNTTDSSLPLSQQPPLPHQLQDHPLDIFHSGQYIIANIHLGETLRKEWKRHRYPTAAEPSTDAATATATATTTTTIVV